MVNEKKFLHHQQKLDFSLQKDSPAVFTVKSKGVQDTISEDKN